MDSMGLLNTVLRRTLLAGQAMVQMDISECCGGLY